MVTPKIEFIGVTEDHAVPNPRNACKPGILVAAVQKGRIRAVFAATSGNLADLRLTNPIGFGRSKAGWHYNGRSLRELPKSSFTLVVDKNSGDELMPGFVIEPRNFPNGKSNWLTRLYDHLRGRSAR